MGRGWAQGECIFCGWVGGTLREYQCGLLAVYWGHLLLLGMPLSLSASQCRTCSRLLSAVRAAYRFFCPERWQMSAEPCGTEIMDGLIRRQSFGKVRVGRAACRARSGWS